MQNEDPTPKRKNITVSFGEYEKLRALKEYKENVIGISYDWGQFLMSLASDTGSSSAAWQGLEELHKSD